ncbi:MAG: septum formation protein Maf [Clostridia bacterium]|nr:septum formation protein Maf [Clostridia bacterium]
MELILASASQRRQYLMRMCGYEFTVTPSKAEEKIDHGDPVELVKRLSLLKAEDVFLSLPPERRKEAVVVGSDTVVVLEGRIIGKPATPDEAFEMLRAESGKVNRVYTGLAVVTEGENGPVSRVCCDVASVSFSELTDEEILDYIATGEPMDKAGAYGIQGRFSMHVNGIEGSYFTVVGLPLHLLYRELKAVGVTPRREREESSK